MADFPGGASAANRASYILGAQTLTSLAGLPTARVAANGNKPIQVYELGFAMNGKGGSRTVRVFIEDPGTGRVYTIAFPLASSTQANDAFGLGIGPYLIPDAHAQAVYVGIETNDDTYYGWNSTPGLTIFTSAPGGVERNNASLAGYFNYYEVCSAPTITSVVSSTDGTSATVTYTVPVSNGGVSLSGYNVQRATNSGFTTGVTTIARSSAQLTAVFTGLTPGQTYYYRVTATNAVSTAAGALGGTWSNTFSRTQNSPAGLGRQYRGGVWVDNKARRWSGSAWQNLDGRRWSGSAWLPLGD